LLVRETERSVVEKLYGLAVPPPDTGSFDCVRLSPHFAQDDREIGDRKFWETMVTLAGRRGDG